MGAYVAGAKCESFGWYGRGRQSGGRHLPRSLAQPQSFGAYVRASVERQNG
jgi:hypothetical protein